MPDSQKILCFDTPRATVPGHSVPTEPIYEIDPGSSDVLADLICAMKACGQDPVTQLSGYIITEDPTYLPEAANESGITARAIARRVGRDKLLTTLIELYLSSCTAAPSEKV